MSSYHVIAAMFAPKRLGGIWSGSSPMKCRPDELLSRNCSYVCSKETWRHLVGFLTNEVNDSLTSFLSIAYTLADFESHHSARLTIIGHTQAILYQPFATDCYSVVAQAPRNVIAEEVIDPTSVVRSKLALKLKVRGPFVETFCIEKDSCIDTI